MSPMKLKMLIKFNKSTDNDNECERREVILVLEEIVTSICNTSMLSSSSTSDFQSSSHSEIWQRPSQSYSWVGKCINDVDQRK